MFKVERKYLLKTDQKTRTTSTSAPVPFTRISSQGFRPLFLVFFLSFISAIVFRTIFSENKIKREVDGAIERGTSHDPLTVSISKISWDFKNTFIPWNPYLRLDDIKLVYNLSNNEKVTLNIDSLRVSINLLGAVFSFLELSHIHANEAYLTLPSRFSEFKKTIFRDVRDLFFSEKKNRSFSEILDPPKLGISSHIPSSIDEEARSKNIKIINFMEESELSHKLAPSSNYRIKDSHPIRKVTFKDLKVDFTGETSKPLSFMNVRFDFVEHAEILSTAQVFLGEEIFSSVNQVWRMPGKFFCRWRFEDDFLFWNFRQPVNEGIYSTKGFFDIPVGLSYAVIESSYLPIGIVSKNISEWDHFFAAVLPNFSALTSNFKDGRSWLSFEVVQNRYMLEDEKRTEYQWKSLKVDHGKRDLELVGLNKQEDREIFSESFGLGVTTDVKSKNTQAVSGRDNVRYPSGVIHSLDTIDDPDPSFSSKDYKLKGFNNLSFGFKISSEKLWNDNFLEVLFTNCSLAEIKEKEKLTQKFFSCDLVDFGNQVKFRAENLRLKNAGFDGKLVLSANIDLSTPSVEQVPLYSALTPISLKPFLFHSSKERKIKLDYEAKINLSQDKNARVQFVTSSVVPQNISRLCSVTKINGVGLQFFELDKNSLQALPPGSAITPNLCQKDVLQTYLDYLEVTVTHLLQYLTLRENSGALSAL